jgi:hypothetical protein
VNDLVTWLNWVIVVEYALLGVLGLAALAVRLAVWLRERATRRRIELYMFTQHPLANLSPPTMIELTRPGYRDPLELDDS